MGTALADFGQVIQDVPAAYGQQGAPDVAAQPVHSCQPLDACPSQQVQEKGLYLVVGMVGYGYHAALSPLALLLKPGVAQLSACHFDRAAMGLLPGCHVEVLHRQGYSKAGAEVAHELLVAHRLVAAQVEVAMRRMAMAVGFKQRTQQCHRVGPAAQCHQHGLAH